MERVATKCALYWTSTESVDCPSKGLINEFTNNGSYHKSHGESIVKPTLDKGCLFDKYLLVPVKRLLSTDRWGYDRDETHSSSRPIDFDLSINTDKYNEIEKTEIVLILSQHAG